MEHSHDSIYNLQRWLIDLEPYVEGIQQLGTKILAGQSRNVLERSNDRLTRKVSLLIATSRLLNKPPHFVQSTAQTLGQVL